MGAPDAWCAGGVRGGQLTMLLMEHVETFEWRGLRACADPPVLIWDGKVVPKPRPTPTGMAMLCLLLKAKGAPVPSWKFHHLLGGGDLALNRRVQMSKLRDALEATRLPFTIPCSDRGKESYFLEYTG